MAQQTFTQNASASLTANGTSTATGSITWTTPTLPQGATQWDSITISGMWTWGGKGSITRVTINNANTSTGVAFNIALPITQTSPLRITCVGNKNATGSSFSWSNLVVTYVCTVVGGEELMLKVNGTWQTVTSVYKKINGVWVLQDNLADLFNENTNYLRVEAAGSGDRGIISLSIIFVLKYILPV